MEAFEKLVSMLDYPMYIVTTQAGEERAGCLVGFTSQVSIGPPRFLVGLSERNHTYRVAQRRDAPGRPSPGATHRELARLFGSETGDRTDKFARTHWQEGPYGCRSSTMRRGGSSARCSAAMTSGITSGFCCSRSKERRRTSSTSW